MRLKSFLTIAVAFSALSLPAFATQSSPTPINTNNPAELRIAVVASGTSGKLSFAGIPQLIANDAVFKAELAKRNIKLTWVPVTTAAVGTLVNESFINKKIDFAFYGDLPSVILNASGVSTKLVVPGSIGNNVYLVVPPDSPAKSIADLKGKKIALHRGRPWEANFGQLISSQNLKLQDFKIINLNPQAGAAALSGKSVDAFFTLSDAYNLVDKKLGKIIWSTQALPADWKMRAELWGSTSFITQYPGVTQLLADADVRAIHWVSQDQNKLKFQQTQAQFGQPLSVIQRDSANKTTTWKQDWSPVYNTALLQSHYQKVINHAYQNRLISKPLTASQLFNPQFTNAALKNLKLEQYWTVSSTQTVAANNLASNLNNRSANNLTKNTPAAKASGNNQ